MTLSGSITASAEIAAGILDFAKAAAGAEGTVVSATGYATVTNSGISKGYRIAGGRIEVYAKAKLFFKTLWSHSWKVFDGWSTSG